MEPTNEVDLSIIMVNWNSKDYVKGCLLSILKNPPGCQYEIIVVDNASFDGCRELLERDFPFVRYVQSETNAGFALANNLGAKIAVGKVYLFLNPDTEIIGHAIEPMYQWLFKSVHAGAVGCQLLNGDGSIQTSCVQSIPTISNQILNSEILRQAFPKSKLWGVSTLFDESSGPSVVEAVSGACLMMHRSVFVEIGGFSTDYFMYGEDIDLCFKAHKAGYKNYYIPEARIVHYGGGSTLNKNNKFANVMMRESMGRFFNKFYGKASSHMYRFAILISALFRLFLIVLFLPVYIMRRKSKRWFLSYQKWFSIFRWSIGLERWVKKYNSVFFS